MQIHEKSERLRDKLLAIKGWAVPPPSYFPQDQRWISSEYGGVSIAYKSESSYIKTCFYIWEDNTDKGSTRLDIYDYSKNVWNPVEMNDIERTLDSILNDLDTFIRSRTRRR